MMESKKTGLTLAIYCLAALLSTSGLDSLIVLTATLAALAIAARLAGLAKTPAATLLQHFTQIFS